jgi:hypothetical protein
VVAASDHRREPPMHLPHMAAAAQPLATAAAWARQVVGRPLAAQAVLAWPQAAARQRGPAQPPAARHL